MREVKLTKRDRMILYALGLRVMLLDKELDEDLRPGLQNEYNRVNNWIDTNGKQGAVCQPCQQPTMPEPVLLTETKAYPKFWGALGQG